jgi:AcrR family transcriptional regulator
MRSLQLGQVDKPHEDLSRRERRNLRQRGEILEAALKLFSEKGYHNVSMHEIAREAEFGIGTLYKFFTGKEDLYKALIREMAGKWYPIIMQTLGQKKDPLRVIKEFVAVRSQLHYENLSLIRLYFAETGSARLNVKAGLDQEVLWLYDEGIEKLASVCERGVREKVFRALDPYHMALALDGIMNAFLFRMMEDPARFGRDDNLSTATDIFLKGVLSK